MPGRRDRPDAGLWRPLEPALRAFLAVSDQWRVQIAPNGRTVWFALDHAAAQAGLALAGLAPDPETWAQVREIAAGARAELNRSI